MIILTLPWYCLLSVYLPGNFNILSAELGKIHEKRQQSLQIRSKARQP